MCGLIFWSAVFSAPAGRAQPVVPVRFLFRADSSARLRHPQALAVDPLGNIYVADTGNHRIVWFSADGKFLRYLGGLGTGREEFDTPVDVCAPDGLNIYVADYNNYRVVRLDRRLNFVASYSGDRFQDEAGQFALPAGVAVSSQGDLFLSEQERNGILKFNAFFQPVSRFGGLESGESVLNRPGQLAVLQNRWLVVVDREAEHLALFDYFGNFAGFFRDSLLIQPEGLWAAQGDSTFLVTDSARNAVFECSPGKVVAHFVPVSREPERRWRLPQDVARIGRRLILLDSSRGAVLVYEILPSGK